MNRVILMGRLTRDPELRYSQGESAMAIARYTLAVNRGHRREQGDNGADFIICVERGIWISAWILWTAMFNMNTSAPN